MNIDIPQNYYRVSIKALVYDQSRLKFLLLQERDGLWALPGGGLDHGELPHECLRREIREEMGLEVTSIAEAPSFLLSSKKADTSSHWVFNVLYETTLGSLDFTPTDECVAIRFVTPEEALTLPAFPSIYTFAEMFRAAKK